MSAEATSSSKKGMDCDRAAREEVCERYLVGRLSEEDRAAFEEHYFGCTRCFDELQTLQGIRDVLSHGGPQSERNTGRHVDGWAPALGLAAALVLAAGAMLWLRSSTPPEAPESQPQLQSRATSSERPTPSASEPAVSPKPSLDELTRVQPPPYQPLRLRGLPDEATTRFRRGMEHYRKADYAAAVADLRAAAALDPEASHVRFFLGISQLMVGQDAAGIERLRATIALGDSPYLEEAHLNLAKALFRRKDFGAAESQLKALIQLRGSKAAEAGRLLTQIQELKKSSD
jgi:tetratricopeptide (TPR) repeat protein